MPTEDECLKIELLRFPVSMAVNYSAPLFDERNSPIVYANKA
ncbi:MAG: hypothetical protein ABIU09_04490 [Pyrinomonadaceae bacterium]